MWTANASDTSGAVPVVSNEAIEKGVFLESFFQTASSCRPGLTRPWLPSRSKRLEVGDCMSMSGRGWGSDSRVRVVANSAGKAAAVGKLSRALTLSAVKDPALDGLRLVGAERDEDRGGMGGGKSMVLCSRGSDSDADRLRP